MTMFSFSQDLPDKDDEFQLLLDRCSLDKSAQVRQASDSDISESTRGVLIKLFGAFCGVVFLLAFLLKSKFNGVTIVSLPEPR